MQTQSAHDALEFPEFLPGLPLQYNGHISGNQTWDKTYSVCIFETSNKRPANRKRKQELI